MLALNKAQSGHQGYKGEKKPHLLLAEGSVLRPVEGSQHFSLPNHLPSWHSPLFLPLPRAQVGLTGSPAQHQVWNSSWACKMQAQTSLALLGDRTSQLELYLKPERYEEVFTQDSLRRKLMEEEARQRAER